ncbi:MAG: hypothetical protein ACI9WU_004639, partial [Myxococcota bacterium]
MVVLLAFAESVAAPITTWRVPIASGRILAISVNEPA